MFIDMVKTLCNNNPDLMDKLNHALIQTVFRGEFTDSEFRIIAELGIIPLSQLQCLIGCELIEVLNVLYIHSSSLRKNNLDETLSVSILKIVNSFCELLTKFVKLLGNIKKFEFIKKVKRYETCPKFYGLAYYEWEKCESVTCPIPFNYILRYGYVLFLYLRNPRLLERKFKKGY